ncbi:TlpA family protein disulfide reductase [Methylopila musalis]|uniref:TlpA family protein disulfide reductase n=1 Tax=Methylopila musalis TaxID=1134781 RepID=A0ABW3Z635_9HYPH
MTAIQPFRPKTLLATLVVMAAAGAASAEDIAFAPFAPPAPISAPTLQLPGLDGAPIALTARPDKPVLLHFFATWCAPCRAELPELARFVAANAKRITVIGVDVGEPAMRVARFVGPFALGFPVAVDEDRGVARALGVKVLPSTIALAPGGAVARVASGPVDWSASETDDAIRSLGAP